MSREHNDFINARDLPESTVRNGPFAGAHKRLLSRDDANGGETALLRFERSWSSDLSGLEGPLELFVVHGELRLGEATLRAEGWARSPRARALGPIAVPAAAEVLVMTDPSVPFEGEASVVDVRALPWRGGVRGGPTGMGVKTLHEGVTVTLITANVARYHSGPEFHECPEELFVIEGDVTGRHGTMTAGSYFWRPEFITHGPYWSESGLLALVRGHGDIHAHWIDNADATVEENRAYAERLRASGGRRRT
jgi:hypothetical protein